MLEYTLFRKLPFGSQVEELHQKGTLLAQREHKDWTITLYLLHNHLVEHWEKNGLEIIGNFKKAVNPMVILEPYTELLSTPEF